jgi:hypothetical protein
MPKVHKQDDKESLFSCLHWYLETELLSFSEIESICMNYAEINYIWDQNSACLNDSEPSENYREQDLLVV